MGNKNNCNHVLYSSFSQPGESTERVYSLPLSFAIFLSRLFRHLFFRFFLRCSTRTFFFGWTFRRRSLIGKRRRKEVGRERLAAALLYFFSWQQAQIFLYIFPVDHEAINSLGLEHFFHQGGSFYRL